MTREQRANLIFVSVLILLIAPGAYILLSKKLRGTSDPNFMPDPVSVSAAYNQPLPVQPGLPRVEPPEARQWIGNLLKDRIDPETSVLRDPSGGPVVTDSFRTQVAQLSRHDTLASAWLVVWDDRNDLTASQPAIVVYQGPARYQSSGRNLERLDVPVTVRHALQKVGYLDPPKRIWLVQADFDAAAAKPDRIELIYADADGKTSMETATLHPR
jgi:hypothetical protein